MPLHYAIFSKLLKIIAWTELGNACFIEIQNTEVYLGVYFLGNNTLGEVHIFSA